MIQELILFPEELYYLGKLLKAKHIDYAYIAAMKDIQQNFEAFKQDVERTLTEKDYICMDFSGDIEIAADVSLMLSPVFFGEFESAINTCLIDGKAAVQTVRIHRDEKLCVCVILMEDGFHIFELSDEQLVQLIVGLLPDNYLSAEIPEKAEISKENITRIIALKNMIIGIQAEVSVYFECGGLLCRETAERTELVDAVTFCEDALRILKGV